MTAIGPTAFATVVWGSLACVCLVFLYELSVIAGDAGWFGPG